MNEVECPKIPWWFADTLRAFAEWLKAQPHAEAVVEALK